MSYTMNVGDTLNIDFDFAAISLDANGFFVYIKIDDYTKMDGYYFSNSPITLSVGDIETKLFFSLSIPNVADLDVEYDYALEQNDFILEYFERSTGFPMYLILVNENNKIKAMRYIGLMNTMSNYIIDILKEQMKYRNNKEERFLLGNRLLNTYSHEQLLTKMKYSHTYKKLNFTS